MANISLEEKRRGSNTSPTKNRPQQITSWIYRACNDLKKDPPECRQCKQPLLIKHLSTTCPEYMPSRNLYLKDLTIREILSENQNFNFTNLVKFLRSTKIFEEILINKDTAYKRLAELQWQPKHIYIYKLKTPFSPDLLEWARMALR